MFLRAIHPHDSLVGNPVSWKNPGSEIPATAPAKLAMREAQVAKASDKTPRLALLVGLDVQSQAKDLPKRGDVPKI